MDVAEARLLMREIDKPVPVKVVLGNIAAMLATWTPNRVRDVWHGDQRIRLDEVEQKQLREAAALAKQLKREDDIARNARDLRARLDRWQAFRAAHPHLDFSIVDGDGQGAGHVR